MHDVFISYSNKDKNAAVAVCHALESDGIRCWIAPRDVLAGKDWSQSILDAITNAKTLVLILSQHSCTSKQVQSEVLTAVQEDRIVVPVRIENINPRGALKLQLTGTHWLDAFPPPLDPHLKKLSKTLQMLLAEGVARANEISSASGPATARQTDGEALDESDVEPRTPTALTERPQVAAEREREAPKCSEREPGEGRFPIASGPMEREESAAEDKADAHDSSTGDGASAAATSFRIEASEARSRNPEQPAVAVNAKRTWSIAASIALLLITIAAALIYEIPAGGPVIAMETSEVASPPPAASDVIALDTLEIDNSVKSVASGRIFQFELGKPITDYPSASRSAAAGVYFVYFREPYHPYRYLVANVVAGKICSIDLETDQPSNDSAKKAFEAIVERTRLIHGGPNRDVSGGAKEWYIRRLTRTGSPNPIHLRIDSVSATAPGGVEVLTGVDVHIDAFMDYDDMWAECIQPALQPARSQRELR